MNIIIDDNRIRTTSEHDSKILRVISKLEGMKKWGKNRSFSFENTPYNLEIWLQAFPDCEIANGVEEEAPHKPADAIFEPSSLRPSFEYKTPPREHQKAALMKIGNKQVCGLFMDVGTGKTWTGITIVGKKWCDNQIDQFLLIAKNGIHEQWIKEQFPKHMSDSVKWRAWIWSDGKRALAKFDEMMRFDGLRVFAINTETIFRKNAEKKIMEFLRAGKGRTIIIVDESQDIKTNSAQRTEAAIRYGQFADHKMIMTGTPISKNVVDLYSQFKFLDEKILGHRYVTTFRNKYCEFIPTEYGPKIVGQKNVEELYNRIDPYIYRITSKEALDLPTQLFIPRKFVLSKRQYELIDDLKNQFYTQVTGNDTVSVKNAVSLLTRMQQISNGFCVTEEGKTLWLDNPRWNACLDILEQRQDKIIIWCRFHEDIETVMDHLGSEAVDYYGKTKNKQRIINKQLFIDPYSSKKYFVASAETAGTGTDGLQEICHAAIYYSNSFYALGRWQSEGRIWRDGTTLNSTYFDLIAKGAPDRGILNNLKEKKNISDLTLDGFRELMKFEKGE